MDQVRAFPRIHDLVQMLVDGFCGGVHCGVRVLFVDDVIFVCEHFVAFAYENDVILATVSSSVSNS